ncbi:MAG TPA: D-arabinono-1,4-lactone oxidase [Stenotrophobium sp.]|jgi:FAD-linked oxidoreductase|nr:D-arabinono-1,4-lactone oxidase [Stenotrophobium sp.]
MSLTRRELIKHAGAMGLFGLGGSFSKLAQAAARLNPMPWRNWSGAQSCIPDVRSAPENEAMLADLIRKANNTVRAVGSGHSFSPLVPTDGTLVTLNNMSGLISVDPQTMQSEFWGGTTMTDMGEPLLKAGLALPNMSDIDVQSLAGAISTSTHGTGPKFGSYSTTVIGLRMITARGDIIDLDKDHQPELFNAARVGLGSLGIITRVRLQNRKAFRLHQKQWIQKTEELLEDMPRLVRENDHFEMNPILHSDVALAQTQNETTDPHTIAKIDTGDGDKVSKLRMVNTYARNYPKIQADLLNLIVKHIDFPDVQDQSFRVFANVRDQRFNEMEYEIPAEHGPACVREILKTVRERNLDSFFPLEYRYVKGDDIPLSMFQGRDTCAISVHQSYEMSYHQYFAQIEPIFWKYEGRPHWGKLHTLRHKQFAALYPRWKEFLEIRQSIDPTGKFLNGHLEETFGVKAGSCRKA